MNNHKYVLGIEFGSTTIKSVLVDEAHKHIASGSYTWASIYDNGIWTYSLDNVWAGLKESFLNLSKEVENKSGKKMENICAIGISAMMHGYLVFDKDWKLLTPFRTWQNTITGEAAEELSALFGFNIPQRWSIAHLYQAILNGEDHVAQIAHITTLAGYVHYMLTGKNAVGIGEASGIFPIDTDEKTYDENMLGKFDSLIENKNYKWALKEILPKVLLAGENAGGLTYDGAKILGLDMGIPFAPPEGDAGTGMTATNSVAPRTGNISAGTSIFSMVVLEKPLKNIYPEVDILTTPTGMPVAMVHCNNCTNDMNAWASVIGEAAGLFGREVSVGELFTKLYEKSMEGEADCGGMLVYNYLAGESITHLDSGRPMVVRKPESRFTLANFLRAQLYSTMATLKIGMDLLAHEDVKIDHLYGHGGLFKTPIVGQKYIAAATNSPVSVMDTAAEGGPYGAALLAAYMLFKSEVETLEDYLENKVFKDVSETTVQPDKTDVEGFNNYLTLFKNGLSAEKAAVESL